MGSTRDPEFNESVYKEEFVVSAAGNYTLAFRNTNGAVYIDRFKLESSSSSAQPAFGPGQTSSSVNTEIDYRIALSHQSGYSPLQLDGG